MQMFGMAMQLAARYKKEPADNLTTTLMNVEIDGEKLSEIEFCSFFLLLLGRGQRDHAHRHDQRHEGAARAPRRSCALLANDPSLVPTAVEEFVRFDPAVHHFRRTATQDVEIRGQQDPRGRQGRHAGTRRRTATRTCSRDPDRFDVTRQENEHLAFGIGEHYCLGANLARLELTVIFQEILKRLRNPRLGRAAAPAPLELHQRRERDADRVRPGAR